MMMGALPPKQNELFYDFCPEKYLPNDHLLRQIDQVLDLSHLRQHLSSFYSFTGRPSIDPELMIRMLIVGYCYGIRSERRLCEEVHLNLAYRWFCRLGLADDVPDHSTANRQRGVPSSEALDSFDDEHASRPVRDYLNALDKENLSTTTPKNISLTDPQARWTAAPGGPAFYAYSTNYLIDIAHNIIVDVEPTPAHRSLEVESTKVMLDRVEQKHDLKPARLIGDTAYGTAPMLAWMVQEKGIAPHVPVWDKSDTHPDVFGRSDFVLDAKADCYHCPGGKQLQSRWRHFTTPRSTITKTNTIIYRSSQHDCKFCEHKTHCCPNTAFRKITRSVHEDARDVTRALSKTSEYQQSRKDRKKVEILFAHLKRIMKLDRLRLCGLTGAHDEFLMAATVQNLKRLAKLRFKPPDNSIGVPA
jgi:transposase